MRPTRRDALKTLAGIASAAGLTVQPIPTREVDPVDLVVLKSKRFLGIRERENVREIWKHAVDGTSLERTRVLILDDGFEIEFVRGGKRE